MKIHATFRDSGEGKMGYVIGELKVSALCYRQRRHGREDVSRIGWELIKIDRVKLLINGIKGWKKWKIQWRNF